MDIKNIKGSDVNGVMEALCRAICESRFTCDVLTPKRGVVRLSTVRLKEKKAYCGNHPKACERPHNGPHSKQKWLEGADWVEFNDMVNDVLDDLNAEADVSSAVCIIRKGPERRTYYGGDKFQGTAWQWNKDDPLYEDRRGMPHEPSEFPMGTPGIHTKKQYHCVG